MIFANQIHSQNDTSILGPFDAAGPSRMDTNRLARRAQKWPKSGRFGPPITSGPPQPGGDLGASNWGRAGKAQDRRAEFGSPNPVVQTCPEIAGRKVAEAGRIPGNRGPIWEPNLRLA